jgi:hypothetical protein
MYLFTISRVWWREKEKNGKPKPRLSNPGKEFNSEIVRKTNKQTKNSAKYYALTFCITLLSAFGDSFNF